MKENKVLLICNEYPSDNDIYKNGFIHRRVKLYLKNNINVIVFCVNIRVSNFNSEDYDGIIVLRGNQSHYEKYIKETEFSSYLIHFISQNKLNPIIENIENPR